MRHNKLVCMGVLFVAMVGVVSLASAQRRTRRTVLLATTNQGELVQLVIGQRTARADLIGDAGILEDGREPGWTGLSLDSEGNLFVSSRHRSEPETDGCFGLFGVGGCSHLYRIDPRTGAILEHIGSTEKAFLSDIDFTPDGSALYGGHFLDETAVFSGLLVIDPSTAFATPIGRFENAMSNIPIDTGGLSVHPQTGEIWGTEFTGLNPKRLYRVDPETGVAISGVSMALNGEVLFFGIDALEILPNGRFIGIRGGGGPQGSQVYEIDPVPDEISGFHEVTQIPVVMDPRITGNLNGLETARQGGRRDR